MNKTLVQSRTDSVSLDHSEASQEDQVNGSFLPLNVERDEKSDGQEECRDQEGGPGLHELLHAGGEEEHSAYQSRHRQLN